MVLITAILFRFISEIMTGDLNSVKRSSRMINSHDKQVDIIRNNPGVILSVTKKYDGKAFPFSVTFYLF